MIKLLIAVVLGALIFAEAVFAAGGVVKSPTGTAQDLYGQSMPLIGPKTASCLNDCSYRFYFSVSSRRRNLSKRFCFVFDCGQNPVYSQAR